LQLCPLGDGCQVLRHIFSLSGQLSGNVFGFC
jgi:hypothetical protein